MKIESLKRLGFFLNKSFFPLIIHMNLNMNKSDLLTLLVSQEKSRAFNKHPV